MSSLSDSDIKRKFMEAGESGQIDDIKVTYLITGGPPGKRIEEEIAVSGTEMRFSIRDQTKSPMNEEFFRKVDTSEIRSLFKDIGSGLDSLSTSENAKFLPDSLVGSITVTIGSKRSETYYFLADEEDRVLQSKVVSPHIVQAIRKFENISRAYRR